MASLKLTAKSVETAKPGLHVDAHCRGLYLKVYKAKDGNVTRSFHFRALVPDRKRPVFLTVGKRPSVTLQAARDTAGRLKSLRDTGATSEQLKAALKRDKHGDDNLTVGPTLGDAFFQFLNAKWDDYKTGGTDPMRVFEMYWRDTVGKVHLRDLTRQELIKHVKPFADRPRLFSRIRQGINQALSYAIVHEPNLWPVSPMPTAREWRAITQSRIGKSRTGHAAVDYTVVPQFFRQLINYRKKAKRGDLADLALQFIILTGARSGEVVGDKGVRKQLDGSTLHVTKTPMQWRDVDFKNRVWTVQLEAMKTGEPHQVPLSDQAIAILKSIGPGAPDDYVFYRARCEPSRNYAGRVLMKMRAECLCIVDQNGKREIKKPTVHGFRSTFIDWSRAEMIPAELSEECLAHSNGEQNETREHYARASMLQLRAPIMQMWADYLHGKRPAPDPAKLLEAKLNAFS